MNGNPMGINGPNWSGNASQSDYRVPTNPQPATFAVGANVLNLTWPIPAYNQNLGSAPSAAPRVFYPQNLNALQVSSPGHS